MNGEPRLPGLPARIGPFAVRARLGVGGMGVVYRGVSAAGEQVAIKLIKSAAFASDDERDRFAQEVESLKTVYGPRVVSFMAADPAADEPWLAVSYIPGPTLAGYVAKSGCLATELVAILGAALAEGLATIHEAGLLHRDLKPQNIILGPDGPIVIDFGLAVLTAAKVELAEGVGARPRVTPPGVAVGTLTCMPPEQLRAEGLTAAADLYALGATLVFAATARYPFDSTNDFSLMKAIDSPTVTPTLDEVPPALVPVISDMLSYDPADRPSLREVTERLVGVVTDAGLTATGARRTLADVTRSAVAPTDNDDQRVDGRSTTPVRGPRPSVIAPAAERAAEELRRAYRADRTL